MNDAKSKKNIAVIGDSEFRLGFQLAGIEKTYTEEDYKKKIQEILNHDKIGILIAKQKDISQLSKRIQNQVNSSTDPVVVTLSEDAESEHLQKKIKKAIGADITS